MGYRLEIPKNILKKLRRLDTSTRERILEKLDEILNDPERYKPLRYELKGKRSARVGKWRIIYKIDGDKVVILSVAHRKRVYETDI